MFLRRSGFSCFVLVSAVVLSPALAQTATDTPANTVSKARSLYYTPVDRGLQSFHCEVSFDWKNFIQKATNQAVPDDDARLKYLRAIVLSMDDDLRSGGTLHWSAPTTAPEGTEDSVTAMRSGLQQILSDFFRSWNGYATGDMTTLDTQATVKTTPAGYLVTAQNSRGVAEEQYDRKLTLTSVHVSTPTLDTSVSPVFTPSAQGLLLTSLHSVYRQLPGADTTEVSSQVQYAEVNSFQLPSELLVTTGAAAFDFHLNNCTVSTQLTAK